MSISITTREEVLYTRLPVLQRVFVVLCRSAKELPFDWLECHGCRIWQGYIEDATQTRIRDRSEGEFLYLTKTERLGDSWTREKSISEEGYDILVKQTAYGIDFDRLFVPWEGVEILLDVFGLEGEQYMRAKVKFETESEMVAFQPPDWLREVTGDESHSMRSIAKNGFPDK